MLRKFSDFLSGKASIFIILTALKQVLSESMKSTCTRYSRRR